MQPAFKVLNQRVLHGKIEAEPGDTVYRCKGYDYGCASDDTRILKIKHISVTKDPEGPYPFFTIPVHDLEPSQ